MQLPLLKALVVVISASLIALGVALAPSARIPKHTGHTSPNAIRTSTRRRDGLQLLVQLAEGHVTPDTALKYSWADDVTAVAHSLGLTDAALADRLSSGRSLSQITAARGVPMTVVTKVLLSHVRGDFRQAELDRAVSSGAARALLNAVSTALGNP